MNFQNTSTNTNTNSSTNSNTHSILIENMLNNISLSCLCPLTLGISYSNRYPSTLY